MGRRAGGRKGDGAALLLRSCWRELAGEPFEVFVELTARLREVGGSRALGSVVKSWYLHVVSGVFVTAESFSITIQSWVRAQRVSAYRPDYRHICRTPWVSTLNFNIIYALIKMAG